MEIQTSFTFLSLALAYPSSAFITMCDWTTNAYSLKLTTYSFKCKCQLLYIFGMWNCIQFNSDHNLLRIVFKVILCL